MRQRGRLKKKKNLAHPKFTAISDLRIQIQSCNGSTDPANTY